MKVEINLEGLDGVLETLKKLPLEVMSKGNNPVRKSLRKGALVIKNQAKKNAPVDTGELRDSIQVKRAKMIAGQNGERYIVRAGETFFRQYVKNKHNIRKGRATQVTAQQYEVEDMPSVYGRFLEYGTSKMAAKPWLRPAVAAKANESIEVTRAEFLKELDKVVAKLAVQNKGK